MSPFLSKLLISMGPKLLEKLLNKKERKQMNNSKSWYASSGMWGGIVATLGGIAGVAGYTLSPELITDLTAVCVSVASALGGVVAIVGRLRAVKRIK